MPNSWLALVALIPAPARHAIPPVRIFPDVCLVLGDAFLSNRQINWANYDVKLYVVYLLR